MAQVISRQFGLSTCFHHFPINLVLNGRSSKLSQNGWHNQDRVYVFSPIYTHTRYIQAADRPVDVRISSHDPQEDSWENKQTNASQLRGSLMMGQAKREMHSPPTRCNNFLYFSHSTTSQHNNDGPSIPAQIAVKSKKKRKIEETKISV